MVTADGALGHPPGAPYDRVIATAPTDGGSPSPPTGSEYSCDRTLGIMETSEPFQTGADRVWHHTFDPSTQLHTVTIKNDEGDVLISWTMTKDDVRRMASALLGCVDGDNDDPAMVVTEDAIITMQMSGWHEGCDG